MQTIRVAILGQGRSGRDIHGAYLYLALFDGEVLWDGPDMATIQRLEQGSGRDWQSAPQFVVRCVAPEDEIEQFGWYEAEARRLPAEPATPALAA